MDRTHKNSETAARPRGIAGDFHTLKAGSAATADELREFVRQLKGKSPQEMLGIVAQSGLFIGTVQATILTVLVVGIFTIGPFYWYQLHPADAVAHQPATAPSQDKSPAEPAKSPATASATATSPAAAPSNTSTNNPPSTVASKNDKGKLLEKLNMDESKKADPNANPLENKADDLLKDLK